MLTPILGSSKRRTSLAALAGFVLAGQTALGEFPDSGPAPTSVDSRPQPAYTQAHADSTAQPGPQGGSDSAVSAGAVVLRCRWRNPAPVAGRPER